VVDRRRGLDIPAFGLEWVLTGRGCCGSSAPRAPHPRRVDPRRSRSPAGMRAGIALGRNSCHRIGPRSPGWRRSQSGPPPWSRHCSPRMRRRHGWREGLPAPSPLRAPPIWPALPRTRSWRQHGPGVVGCGGKRVIRTSPQHDTTGPTDINRRGPIRWARLPNRAASNNMTTVIGSSAVPAIRGLNPDTVCTSTTRRNNAQLMAARAGVSHHWWPRTAWSGITSTAAGDFAPAAQRREMRPARLRPRPQGPARAPTTDCDRRRR
jgi:hypothetical protein